MECVTFMVSLCTVHTNVKYMQEDKLCFSNLWSIKNRHQSVNLKVKYNYLNFSHGLYVQYYACIDNLFF